MSVAGLVSTECATPRWRGSVKVQVKVLPIWDVCNDEEEVSLKMRAFHN